MLIRHFHSVHEQYPVLAFLDIKSAYDTADRSIIWGFLRQSVSTITIALATFDHDEEYTTPRRGRLWHRPDNNYIIINSLLYADDIVLFGSANDIATLLQIAENHARSSGYRWHPGKCAIIDSTPQPLSYRLYDECIPQVSTFKYLELPFTHTGLDRDLLVKQRCSIAAEAMALLRHLGVHQYGFGLGSALRAYRTFIRFILEYGVAISALTSTQKRQLQNLQVGCLR
ncbi:hypothetical protein VTP01DRAFT_7072 [Rhizomucor pusillus]|uniref:uncharacterized protein n=1 Tax=Rhizomucor pusillus TaxID=4840 RepID=UPI0037443C7C